MGKNLSEAFPSLKILLKFQGDKITDVWHGICCDQAFSDQLGISTRISRGDVMSKQYLFLVIIAVSGAWLLCWDCGSGLAEHQKSWIYESDFLGDSNVKATPRHTVVLGIEKDAPKTFHSIPYVFEERTEYNFCIDEDDPLIDSMKLVNARGVTIARVNKKHRCVKKTIPKGRYEMRVYHDGNAVGDSLRYAFIHTPKTTLRIGENNPSAARSSAAAQRGGEVPPRAEAIGDLPSGGYWTIEANNGKPLRFAHASTGIVASDDQDLPIIGFNFENGGFQISGAFFHCCHDPLCNWCCFNAYPNTCGSDAFLLMGSECDDPGWGDSSPYTLYDKGDYTFTLSIYQGMLMLQGDTVVLGCPSGTLPPETLFRVAAVGNVSRVPPDSLQKGQIVLYDWTDCYPYSIATLVMPGNHVVEASAESVRIPHDTRVTLYPQGSGNPVVLKGGPPRCINVGSGFVAERVTVEYTKDILISTKQCRHCDLYGLSFQNMNLDGVDLSYAYLADTHFNNSSMKGANLSYAVLANAQLDLANLQGANMCNALLQGNVESANAASLKGAYMKNVNLSGANLSGVIMTNADFYNTGVSPCPASCDSTQMTSACATAAYATMDLTQAAPAYLARTDFSQIRTTGANFSGAILVGANFSNAQLQTDTSSTAKTNFSNTFLQGANFAGASGPNVSFSGAYVDLNPKTHLGFLIPGDYTGFTGFWSTPDSTLCVDNLNPAATVVPATTSSNACPDGLSGPCSNLSWTFRSNALEQAVPKAGYNLCPCDPFGNCGDKTWSSN